MDIIAAVVVIVVAVAGFGLVVYMMDNPRKYAIPFVSGVVVVLGIVFISMARKPDEPGKRNGMKWMFWPGVVMIVIGIGLGGYWYWKIWRPRNIRSSRYSYDEKEWGSIPDWDDDIQSFRLQPRRGGVLADNWKQQTIQPKRNSDSRFTPYGKQRYSYEPPKTTQPASTMVVNY